MVALGIVQALVVLASVGICGLSVLWTVRSWVKLNSQDYEGWVESRCVVLQTGVTQDASSLTSKNNYRSEVYVNSTYYSLWGAPPFDIPDPVQVTAFRTGNPLEYKYSFGDAEEFSDSFAEGSTHLCWFAEQNPLSVKLTSNAEGTLAASESTLRRSAIVSTSLCVLTSVCALLAVVVVSLTVSVYANRSRQAEVEQERNSSQRRSSTTQIDDENPLLPSAVVSVSEQRIIELKEQHECCSVCLDPLGWRYSTDATSTASSSAAAQHGAVMELPCAHNFHEFCVLAWYARGNTLCPVCKQAFLPQSPGRAAATDNTSGMS
eukprot:CAMPEP_0185849120 /NCGR_PEP_ID=MMETSP1354-20130828/3741_1 /TAXON_ID=708628 /ORGANISM="Erythrolobus madagascarensis, Strain CCMP3276" /LENGTH=319 /DNA_ID=CAMNT_0028549601 /DNA_START=191 /DNA_END=1150 /DNA_ORIENTATION=-